MKKFIRKNYFFIFIFILSIVISFAIFLLFSKYNSFINSKATSNINSTPINLIITTSKRISLNQLNQHNTQENCYVSYLGDVYNISTFIIKHPGGKLITTKCGQIIDTFSSLHPGGSFDLPKIQSILSPLIIGKLENS